MAITTAQKIQEVCSLEQRVANKVEEYITDAEFKIRELITDAKYEEIRDDSSHEYYERVQRAESVLAYYYALPFIALRHDGGGGFVTATGFNESRVNLGGNRFQAQVGARLMSRAKKMIRDLIIAKTRKTRPFYYTNSVS